MTESKVFQKADGSPDQRAYDIANAIKHCGDAIKRADHGPDLTVPVWLENQGFRSSKYALTYDELGLLMSQAAQLADDLQNPQAFAKARSHDSTTVEHGNLR